MDSISCSPLFVFVICIPIGILGQVWCLIVSIPDLCPLSYFLIYEWKNVRDAHKSRLFGHTGQILKWMDLRVSPILRTLFDRCDT